MKSLLPDVTENWNGNVSKAQFTVLHTGWKSKFSRGWSALRLRCPFSDSLTTGFLLATVLAPVSSSRTTYLREGAQPLSSSSCKFLCEHVTFCTMS
jgi:hypothetical protein